MESMLKTNAAVHVTEAWENIWCLKSDDT